jgi:putative peptide zinc metalloprotease protein
MNLSQIMASALPELPAQLESDRPPRIHPQLIVREDVEREGELVRAILPGGARNYFRMTKQQFAVAALFDGNRSYEEIAALCATRLELQVTVDDVRQFAEVLAKDNFWYRTAQEESAFLASQSLEQRHKYLAHKTRNVDPTTIELYYFTPTRMIDWVYAHFKWLYSPWFTAWSLVMIGVMCVILGSHWSVLWNDSIYFYNLKAQPLFHVFEFFAIFLLLGTVHEFAHGLSCHHYGGKSHRMGIFLMYLMPGVFCDCAEAFVRAGRWGRIVTIAAGVWSEIVLCSYLSVVWWLTPPGSALHNFAYILILSGGILAVVVNWNPLSRMDGYFIFCEFLRFHDLKGNSTAYLVALVRKHIFRMPATVAAMPPLRRVGFVTYALLSGAYCYFLLGALCRITYHILYIHWPQWAFAPAMALGLLIFRSRIRKLLKFFRELYLDKREVMRKNWIKLATAAGVALVVFAIPMRREKVEEHFVLEPVRHAVVRSEVPGRVVAVLADEGQPVAAGATVVQLRNLAVESRAARTAAEYRMATARATDAQLRYADFGAADQKRVETDTAYRLAQEQAQKLEVKSPVTGVVVTPRVHDLLGSYVTAGTKLAEISDTTLMRARVFVREPELKKLQHITGNALWIEGMWKARRGQVAAISPAARELPEGLEAPPKYEGIRNPAFFTVDILLPNSAGDLRPGMTGTAKLYGSRRRSVLGSVLEPLLDAVARRLW